MPPSPKYPQARKRRAAAASAAASLVKPAKASRKPRISQSKRGFTPSTDTNSVDNPTSDIADLDLLEPPSYYEISLDELHVDFIPPPNPLDEAFSLERAIGDVNYSYRSRPVFERMAELRDFRSTCQNSPLMSPSSTSSLLGSNMEVSHPHSAIVPMSQVEREAHYDWLNSVLGPSSGVQESIGTYKAHMECQRQLYFERLLYSDSRRWVAHVDDVQAAQDSRLPSSEFKNWVSCTSVTAASAPASRCLSALAFNTALAEASTLPDALDSLFPSSGLDYVDSMPNSSDLPVHGLEHGCDVLSSLSHLSQLKGFSSDSPPHIRASRPARSTARRHHIRDCSTVSQMEAKDFGHARRRTRTYSTGVEF